MKKIDIKLLVGGLTGTKALSIQGTILASELTEHDAAGLLFAVEFAVNNEASKILGKPVRMHIEVKDVE